jgi:type IV fimbrial biogenesis protein FimT
MLVPVRRTSLQRPDKAAGFTLIELMVVVLLTAILLAVGVPALQSLMAANQLNAVTDSFAGALNEARSEAAKFGVPVAVTSTVGGVNWGGGWTIFVDTNGNGVLDSGQTPPEVKLRASAAVPSSFTVTANGASASAFGGVFWFDPTGRLLNNQRAVPTSFAQFQVCRDGGPPTGAARLITVSPSGRVRLAQNNTLGQPIDDNGNPVTACP